MKPYRTFMKKAKIELFSNCFAGLNKQNDMKSFISKLGQPNEPDQPNPIWPDFWSWGLNPIIILTLRAQRDPKLQPFGLLAFVIVYTVYNSQSHVLLFGSFLMRNYKCHIKGVANNFNLTFTDLCVAFWSLLKLNSVFICWIHSS